MYDLYVCMKEIPRKRITVTSSLNEMSTDQLRNRMAVTLPASTPFYSRLLERYLKTT
jgi:hypothetical protein